MELSTSTEIEKIPMFSLLVPIDPDRRLKLDARCGGHDAIARLRRASPRGVPMRVFTVKLEGTPITINWVAGEDHNLRAMAGFTALTRKHMILVGPVVFNMLSADQVLTLARAMMHRLTPEEVANVPQRLRS